VDFARVWPLPVCVVVTGCASILGIPSDSPSFCASPENQGHDYCEDYDVGNALLRVAPGVEQRGPTTIDIEPSDKSPPNLIDFKSPALPADASTPSELAGYYEEFPNSEFVGLRIDADIRFITQNDAGLDANGGFLLVGNTQGACIGLGLAQVPAGVPNLPLPAGTPVLGVIVVPPQNGGCSSLTGLSGMRTVLPPVDGGASDGGVSSAVFVQAPAPNTWFHLRVQAIPDGVIMTGSQLLLTLTPGLNTIPPFNLPAGALPRRGSPLIGFASEVNPPSGPLEVQFDNVTIDVKAQQ
jgi:hypothetical protein